MTDYEDLIKRLRGILSSPRNAWDTFSDTRQVPVAVLTEVADAIEAQAKRIADLGAENFTLAAGQCPLNMVVMDPWGNPKCSAIAAARGEPTDDSALWIEAITDFKAAGKAASEWVMEHPDVLGGQSDDAFLREMAAMADEECPTCDGVGWVEVKVDGGVQCPDCGGTGKKETK
jgi:hypothetical protein